MFLVADIIRQIVEGLRKAAHEHSKGKFNFVKRTNKSIDFNISQKDINQSIDLKSHFYLEHFEQLEGNVVVFLSNYFS